jgi:predicted CopG family antitoxin
MASPEVRRRLGQMRGPGESYSDVIIRVAGEDGSEE